MWLRPPKNQINQSIVFSQDGDYLAIFDFLGKKNVNEVKNKRRLHLAWLAKGFREKKKRKKKKRGEKKENMNYLSKPDL